MGLRLERVVNAGDPGLFVPHPGHSGAPTRSITDIGQEMAAFFAEANLDTVAQSPYIGLIRAIDHLEEVSLANGGQGGEQAAGSTGEAGPANPVDAPQVAIHHDAPRPFETPQAMDHFAGSPLDPFAIHPLDIIPLALALGLVILISFFFLREVWKNWIPVYKTICYEGVGDGLQMQK
ncbi:hypothetical protein SETIT_1G140400v2 [Setaria italica]|uniref:Uncharacterized protein n=1 Tax=Setaria italica TaxID=4555 RepID=K3YYQ3_SETIT|nr:hypothetical protein SETIT_1G140400v2 [Setaria italica]